MEVDMKRKSTAGGEAGRAVAASEISLLLGSPSQSLTILALEPFFCHLSQIRLKRK